MNIINEYDKKNMHSPSFHQGLYQKVVECFSNYIPIHKIPNFSNGEDIHIAIEDLVNNKDFKKSNTEIETYDNREELKFSQENVSNQPIVIILDALKEKNWNSQNWIHFKKIPI